MLSGDEAALGILYDRYGGLVYSVSKHILGDSGAAEEVLQDIFHQIWRTAASFDSARGSLSSWLLVMARNRSIDRVRRRTPSVGEEDVATLHGPGLDLESAAARNEMGGRGPSLPAAGSGRPYGRLSGPRSVSSSSWRDCGSRSTIENFPGGWLNSSSSTGSSRYPAAS
ncbi:MAG: sigma factor [Terriglobia bacterium]